MTSEHEPGFPTWVYFADGTARLVQSAEQLAGLTDWADTPAAFADAPAAETEPAAEPAPAPRAKKAKKAGTE